MEKNYNCTIKLCEGVSKTGNKYYYLLVTNLFGLEEKIFIDKKTVPYYKNIIEGNY